VRQALRGPEVVLFSLNSSRYAGLAAQLGTLVVQDLVAASGDRLSDTHRAAGGAIIGIDEFSGLGADHVIALLSRARESGMSALVATQEMADLNRAAPGLRDQVVGVTAFKIIHRQEVPASARMIAQMIGTEWVWEQTRQTAGQLFGGYDTGRGTRRRVERFIVHPNEIQWLPNGEAIMISKLRGGGPVRVRVERPRQLQSPHAMEPTRPPEPTRPAEAIRPPEPTRPAEAIRPPEPTRPAEAIGPAEPTRSPEPTRTPTVREAPRHRGERAQLPGPGSGRKSPARPPPSDSLGR
jgi:type IV secretory pathway TraG/TraD family ATPase VirD4